ncbi:cell division protein ZapA [Pseudomonas sp. NW5]|uniref:cell division protein ZapA n=1 Tax=Pseudomonas sp. NW5 TaxID=2934934 RepID=UPI0020203C72|nr:cell division protein ZapA [Pseudomonas sp. NW5]MCL7462709.1 cell division protein ZapA [Pseudomonas sp. NW5]
MTQHPVVTVQILDKDYPIGCPPQARHGLERAAHYVDAKMRELRSSGRGVDAERIAVLAALNIAHELLQLQERDSAALEGDTRSRVRELLERVDRALQEPSA